MLPPLRSNELFGGESQIMSFTVGVFKVERPLTERNRSDD
jgi:hypothetical protein